jgi:hypothetical protein
VFTTARSEELFTKQNGLLTVSFGLSATSHFSSNVVFTKRGKEHPPQAREHPPQARGALHDQAAR